jgi:hypothetical protein
MNQPRTASGRWQDAQSRETVSNSCERRHGIALLMRRRR